MLIENVISWLNINVRHKNISDKIAKETSGRKNFSSWKIF